MKKSTNPSEKVKINPKIEQIQLNRRGGASSDQLASVVDLGSSNNSESDGERSCKKRKVDETASFECREICGMDHVRVHPKFLHSNATSHKWVLGAFAELLDNSLDEVCNGATYVNIDMILNKKNGTRMLSIEDVERHNIVNDMMMTQEITYRPQPGADGIPKDTNVDDLPILLNQLMISKDLTIPLFLQGLTAISEYAKDILGSPTRFLTCLDQGELTPLMENHMRQKRKDMGSHQGKFTAVEMRATEMKEIKLLDRKGFNWIFHPPHHHRRRRRRRRYRRHLHQLLKKMSVVMMCKLHLPERERMATVRNPILEYLPKKWFSKGDAFISKFPS
ncbi:hypothetical protein LIER_07017 [Lithospermum erythrorhizon]|uniref:Uncharacterized protein n=1 Tax=Lithospermum erythrorhizon TaxID=34254 RepID=A0AAV3P6Q0_LITER